MRELKKEDIKPYLLKTVESETANATEFKHHCLLKTNTKKYIIIEVAKISDNIIIHYYFNLFIYTNSKNKKIYEVEQGHNITTLKES